MKIALIRRRFTVNGAGGAEKYAAYLADLLIRKGHDVTVFSEEFQCAPREHLEWREVPKAKFRLCPTASFANAVRRVLDPAGFDIVYALCRYYPADIVRISEQLHAVWLPIGYSRFARWNPRHRAILNLEKETYNLRNTRHIVTNSDLLKQQVSGIYHYPAERISTLRNGVDRSKFYPGKNEEHRRFRVPFGIPADHFVMLFVGTNFKIKGLDLAVRAFAGLKEPVRSHATLLVVGGDDPAPYRKLAAKLGLPPKALVFAGNRTDMRTFYVLSDLLFFPSRYEPFANVCLEAAVCGLPVMTSRMNGSSETVRHGQSGYVIDDLSRIDLMTSCLTEYAALSAPEKEAFRTGAQDAVKGYSWEKHADEIEKLINQIKREKSES